MYPTGELEALDRRKLLLRARIARRRWQCRVAGAELARPLEFIDRALAQWRRISPFVKMASVPLGFLFRKKLFPKLGFFSTLLRWAPTAFAAFRSFVPNRA